MSIMQRHTLLVYEVRVVDSDTLSAWVEISDEIRQLWRIRLRGIEGGEADTPEGTIGSVILSNLLLERQQLSPHFIGNPKARDQHGRHVGDIGWTSGENLTCLLLAQGHHWHRNREGREWKATCANANP
jgi:endonuclease YncB( thermonuclease family)